MVRSFTERWATSYIRHIPSAQPMHVPCVGEWQQGYACRESLSQKQQNRKVRGQVGRTGEMRMRCCLFPLAGGLEGRLLVFSGGFLPVFEVADDSWKNWRKMCWRKWRWKTQGGGEIAGKKDGQNKDLKSQHSNVRGHLAVMAEARWGSPVARTPTPGKTALWETMRRVSETHRNPSCGPRAKDAWILVTYPNRFVAFCGL